MKDKTCSVLHTAQSKTRKTKIGLKSKNFLAQTRVCDEVFYTKTVNLVKAVRGA